MQLVAGVPAGWAQEDEGAIGAVTMAPLPGLNGVWVYSLDAAPGPVGELLNRVVEAGLPHCLQLRPGHDPELADLARRRGMTRDEDIPMMVLQDVGALGEDSEGDLILRELAPEQAELHAELMAAAFETPPEPMRQLLSPALMGQPGTRCYLGEIESEPVTTGVGVMRDDYVGIFNIATLAAHRRRGYGAAVTARAVRDALRDGARWAWLQSSPSGFGVYQRLGFTTIERWECWIAGGR